MGNFMKRLGFSVIALGGVLTQSAAHAVPRTCQEALDPSGDSDHSEGSKDAETDAGTPSSEFGPGLFDIDGSTINSVDALIEALGAAKGKTPFIKGGDFSGWNFTTAGQRLSNVCFFQSRMPSSIWDGGNFPGLGFVETDLAASSFKGTELGGVLLRESFLTGVDMRGARLDGGLFDGGWGGGISNWDLTGASLRGFRFRCGLTLADGCPLDRSNVRFVQADLSDADISTYPFWGQADYSDAVLSNTRISPRHLTDIKNANARGVIVLTGGGLVAPLSSAEFAELQKQAIDALDEESKPSFPCPAAKTAVERLICGEQEYGLGRWDRTMARLYAEARARDPSIIADQRKWLKGRSRCKDAVCLSDLYAARAEKLLQKLGEPELLKPGEGALFIDDTVSFPHAFRQTELYRRITPVLVEASLGEAIVERAADGSYSIAGESIAANAHLCSVSGEGLRYDRAKGWFSAFDAEGSAKPAAVFRAYHDQIEFPASGHPAEAEFPGSSDFASCGARASLMPMNRIDVDAGLLARRKAVLGEGY